MSLLTITEAIIAAQQSSVQSEPDKHESLVIETKIESNHELLVNAVQAIFPNVKFTLEPVFVGAEGELSRFFSLTLPSVLLRNLPGGPFDLSYYLHDALDLASCDPIFDSGREPHYPPDLIVPYDPSATESDDGPNDVEWHLKNTRVPDAWAYSTYCGRPTQGKGIVIAQPDTGKAAHNLAESIWHPNGLNLKERDMPPNDPLSSPVHKLTRGHGLVVAITAASRGKNGDKPTLRGVAPLAQVLPIRALNNVFVFGLDAISVARAVYAAVERGVHIISMSFGNLFPLIALQKAINYAHRKNVILVAAAGNKTQWWVVHPARYHRCIAVAGTTKNDKPWEDSAYGKRVDVSAPAENIVTGWRGKPGHPVNKVGRGSGTSYATPIIAGVAALWLAHHGRNALIERFRGIPLQVIFRSVLRKSSRQPEDWDTNKYGCGIVNAEALLKCPLEEITISEHELLTPQDTNYTRGELLTMGADPTIISALSDEEIQYYTNEILYAMEITDTQTDNVPVSNHLLQTMRVNSSSV